MTRITAEPAAAGSRDGSSVVSRIFRCQTPDTSAAPGQIEENDRQDLALVHAGGINDEIGSAGEVHVQPFDHMAKGVGESRKLGILRFLSAKESPLELAVLSAKMHMNSFVVERLLNDSTLIFGANSIDNEWALRVDPSGRDKGITEPTTPCGVLQSKPKILKIAT